MLALYKRQTFDERQTSDTRYRNARGFNVAHVKRGTRFARMVNAGQKLEGWYLNEARKIALRYTRQLLDEAKNRHVK